MPITVTGRRKKPPPRFQLQYDPAEIPKLVAEYMATPYQGETAADKDREMEAAGKRIATGAVTRRDVEIIYEWKSPRRMDLFAKNTDSEIEQALRDAVAARTVREAVDSLTCLQGVGVKMASAILTAIFPESHTVLDFRALEALGAEDASDVDSYVSYLEACRSMASKYGVKLRDFDRANWQWSKNKSLAHQKTLDNH